MTQRELLMETVKINSKHKRKKRWYRIVSVLSAIVVFCTTYALILPAITMTNDTYCGLEHEHTLQCYSNPEADVETPAQWEKTMQNAELLSLKGKDTASIAKTQLGYTESYKNYMVVGGDITKGYTRYGAWYGDEYADWSAMFASFCLYYAGVNDFPYAQDVTQWRETLASGEYNCYYSADEYIPNEGDLLFTNDNHVAVVTDIKSESATKIVAVMGDCNNKVDYVEYYLGDSEILGFAKVDDSANVIHIDDQAEVIVYSEICDGMLCLKADVNAVDIEKYYWQWQSSADGATDWADIQDAYYLEYSTEATDEAMNTYYRLRGVKSKGMRSRGEARSDDEELHDISHTANAFARDDNLTSDIIYSNAVLGVTLRGASGGYWEKVTQIDDTNATYMIVSQSGYAIGVANENAGNASAKAVTFTSVAGSNNYFTCNSNDEQYQWNFESTVLSSGTVSKIKNVAFNTRYLRLTDSSIIATSQSTGPTLNYNSGTEVWTLSYRQSSTRTYYLIYNNGFSRSYANTNTSRRNMVIYKRVPGVYVTFEDSAELHDDVTVQLPIGGGSVQLSDVPSDWTREDYVLVGWTKDNDSTVYTAEEIADMNITEDTTFTAHWAQSVNVSFNLGIYNDFIEPLEDVLVPYGQTLDYVPTPVWKGQYYNIAVPFEGWYTDAECTTPFNANAAITNDMVLYAKWGHQGEGYYVYFYDFDRGNSYETVLVTYLIGEGRTLSPYRPQIQPPAGQEWNGKWYLDSNRTVEYDFTTPVSDMTDYLTGDGSVACDLYLWPGVNDVCRVIFVTNGERIPPINVITGETVDLDDYTPVRAGYHFEGWYTDAELTQPVSGVQTITENKFYYAKWEPAYVPFTPVIHIENPDDNGFETADYLKQGSDHYWYAMAGSVIKVKSNGTTHTVYSELNGVEYPVYTDENHITQATVPDVYSDYFLFNDADTTDWTDVFGQGTYPYSKEPILNNGTSIVHFDYMRARVDLTFNMSNSSSGGYMNMYALNSDGDLPGTTTATQSGNYSASGVTPDGIEWEYTAASANASSGNNVFVLKNLKYEQDITTAFPLQTWLTSRGTGKIYVWTSSNANKDNVQQSSRVKNMLENYLRKNTTGRNTQGCTFTASFGNTNTYALMYAFECLPGETPDFTVGGKSYKVDTSYSQVLLYTSTTGWNAKQIIGCDDGQSVPYTISNGSVGGTSSIGDTRVNSLFTKYQDYYKINGTYNPSSWSRAFLLYYPRKDVTLQFNFMYDADGDGHDDTLSYSNIMYGQSIADYQGGLPNNEQHSYLTRPGYKFVGWMNSYGEVYTNADWSSMIATAEDNTSVMLFAKWERITDNIIEFYSTEHSETPVEWHYFSNGDYVSPPAAVTPDYWVWTNSDYGYESRFDFNIPMYGEYGVWEYNEAADKYVWVVKVYGQWLNDNPWVMYNANVAQGGIQANAPVDNDQYTLGTSRVPVKALTDLTNTQGKIFAGWLLDNNSNVYQPGDHILSQWMPGMTFIAQWVSQENAVYLKYDPNGGTPDTQYPNETGFVYARYANAAVWDNTSNESQYYTKEGFMFDGWNTMADGTGTSYSPGNPITLTEDVTVLYAQWRPATYTVRLHKVSQREVEGVLTQQSLAGVEFDLDVREGNAWQNISQGLITDINGYIIIPNFEINKLYRLTETSSLPGYKLPEDSIYFRVSDETVIFCDSTGNVITPDDFSGEYVHADSAVNMTVINRSGVLLPMTGGIGTQVYTLCGLALIAAALMCGYMLRRKCERRERF
ncbi:MAG: InlB B-repeat-containing protein [Clostridiales bacterium]|nr:InlB B-repeat-containing protein [Clostridiales bacterium]